MTAREGALALLTGVLDAGSSLAEQGDTPLRALPPPERARAQSLALAVLRHLGRLDALIDGFVTKAPPHAARQILRLAAAELLVLNVPAHAVVDGAVRLARARPKTQALAGFVNAVLRRVAADGPERWPALPEAPLPAWIAGPVVATWGETALAGIEQAHALDGVPLDISLRPGEDASLWAEALEAEILPTGSLRRPRAGQVSALPGFAAGAWWVQDAAAALPARLLGPVAGRRAIDVCAAPGGKTLQLAGAGAAVTALDISEPRLRRLHENLARTGLQARIVAGDALTWSPEAVFDAVLLDAPCSATGTLRRHPDLPHLREAGTLDGLLRLQAALLQRTWDWVAPGGRLVYATCSLLPAEGEDQLRRFLADRPEARVVAADAADLGIPGPWLTAAGALRLRPDFWPDRGGLDGFFAVCLARS